MSVKKQTRAAENADPHELNNPVPRVLLGVILALVVWGVYYIFSANPNSVAGLGDRRDPATLVAAARPRTASLMASSCSRPPASRVIRLAARG